MVLISIWLFLLIYTRNTSLPDAVYNLCTTLILKLTKTENLSMNEEQAERIINLLEKIDSKLGELSTITFHVHGIGDDVEDILKEVKKKE